MSIQEIRNFRVVSAFIFFFAVSLIAGLGVTFFVDLDLIPTRIPQPVLYWRARFLELETFPRVVFGSFIMGICGGLVAAIVALIYNMFATLVGGVKIDIE